MPDQTNNPGDALTALLRAIRRPSAILAVFCLGILGLYYGHTAYFQLRPVGPDFVSFWSAARAALDQNPALPYDFKAFSAFQQELIGFPDVAFFYPPIFLMMVTPLGLMPYGLSYAVFQALSLGAATITVGRILGDWRRGWLLLVFPGALFCVMHGQTSLACVVFLGGALLALSRGHQIAAGLFIGLLAIKPQFGLLIPFALLAGGYYRAFAAAGITVLALGGVSALLFGPEVWQAFLAQSSLATETMMKGIVHAEKFASPFGWLVQVGVPAAGALAIQSALSLGLLGWVTYCWWRVREFNIKAMLLGASTCLVTPFMLDYDLALLAIPLAFALRLFADKGFSRLEAFGVLAAVLLPFLTQGCGLTLPVTAGPFPALILVLIASRRAWLDPGMISRT